MALKKNTKRQLSDDVKSLRNELSRAKALLSKYEKAQQETKDLHEELVKSRKRFEELSLRDSHTGVYNHRYLNQAIETAFSEARRGRLPLSVLMLDIDYFKAINDVYGHRFGDMVLYQFSNILKKTSRRHDIIARFGGDEFVIILLNTDIQVARAVAERMLEFINNHQFGNRKYKIRLKVSIGISSYPVNEIAKGMDLVDMADRHMSDAKEEGGSRIGWATGMKRIAETNREATEVKMLKRKIKNLTKRANQGLVEAIYALAKTIEFKDHYSGQNIDKSVYYATEMAKAMNFTAKDVELVRHAAMLHDLGKVGISESILLKKSRLTGSELDRIRRHPRIAVEIMRPIHFLHNAIPLVLHHHERWDGKGYPVGLKGEEIPLGARIIAITDVFQALVSHRSYRKAYAYKEVVKLIKEGSGTRFDPNLINLFLKILEAEKKARRRL